MLEAHFGVPLAGGVLVTINIRLAAKNIIIISGTNISTIEVERAIYKHPAVLEVAVISIPDAKRGEVRKQVIFWKCCCFF